MKLGNWRENMYWKLFKNDIRNNRLQNFNISFFIILSVAFLAVAGQLTFRLNDSINGMFEKAETPHLLQMHKGEIDSKRMQAFVDSHSEIEEYQVLKFLNIDQSTLAFNGVSLKDFVYDNGFSTQSPKFDYLLDLKGNKIQPQKGEVYVPVFYQSMGLVKEGDILSIQDYKLKVKGFVRDSQMNSSLSSSKRFIINEKDYQAIEKFGDLEYLIEFRLYNLKDTSKIGSAYAQWNLESNGPPILSYSLFKIVNAFSDGITIIALLLIGILIIGISFLCIRFTLLSKLEEDYRELAVLKAIGIPFKEIKLLFLSKYLVIAGVSSIVGFFFSFLLKRPFLKNMKMFFGEAEESGWNYFIAFVLSTFIFLIIYLYMNKLAKRLKYLKINEIKEEEKRSFIRSFANLPKTMQLVFSDFFSRKKMYFTLILVFVLSVFIMTIPMSIYSTISNKTFVNYLGIGVYDIRIDIPETAKNEEKLQSLIKELKEDSSIDKFEVYTSKLVDYKTEKGVRQKLWIDSGKQSSFPIKYISGKEPSGENQIALSKLAADELSKKEGDSITLMIGDEERVLSISGIFSDLTNGGKTAKTNFHINNKAATWTVIPIRL
ncbi:MAG: FtsX-like permease family protein, partial [Gemella morbillorum]|nr:FtsX-like permease family protein [Gemella morbillorum]